MLLGLVAGIAEAETTLSFKTLARELIEDRLRQYGGTNAERGARLKQLFLDAGCGEHVIEQPVKRSQVPNFICVLPGTTERVIIVGAHFDRVSVGDGVVDNWSGASLLPSLYQSVSVEPRRHSYVFIGFTDEEKGLVGSRFFVRNMTPAQVSETAAMINMDVLGLAPTEVWLSHSDKRLTEALAIVASHLKLPIAGVNFERIGSTDSEAFAPKKIPRITIHSLTQKTEDQAILHSKKDKLSALNLDYYYDTYRLMVLYLVYLDHFLAQPD